jgi:DNA-binding transcriptional MerR regulator
VLARIRRLTELGLGLTEVRDVLADDAGRDLAEVLEELDADLARQEAAIRERRDRLRALLDREGDLPAEGPVSPELAALLTGMAHGPESPMAARDREVLALIDTVASPESRQRLMAALGSAFETPAAVARAHEVYALLDALADADLDDTDADDPRVDEAARALADCLPDSLLPETDLAPGLDDSFLRALYADVAPAQAEAIRRAMRMFTERGR